MATTKPLHHQTSIKAAERLNRAADNTVQYYKLVYRGSGVDRTSRPAVEQILVQSVQQDQSHQVSGGTMETPTIQTNTALQGIVRDLRKSATS